MDGLTWKHIALAFLALLLVALCAALYTFGGATGQEAAEQIGTWGLVIGFFLWIVAG